MIAGQARHIDCLTARAPINIGNINVWIIAKIDPDGGVFSGCDNAEFDRHIVGTGKWIALADGYNPIGIDIGALGDRHWGFINLCEYQPIAHGRPPIAGIAVQFFLRNKF